MLTTLTIRNVVLIDQMTIDFRDGLTALTGETGAGKSILLDSIGLAIGERAETRLIRHGSDQASVIATFDVSRHGSIHTILKNHDIDIEADEPLYLKRVVTDQGKSRAYIQDQPVSVSLLRIVGQELVEIHGQFQTYGLLNPATHRDLLDHYAGVGDTLMEPYQHWRDTKTHRQVLEEKANSIRTEETYLREALEDLDRLNPQTGEEKTLSDLRTALADKDTVLHTLSAVHATLTADDDPLSSAAGQLARITDKGGEHVAEALDALDRATALVQEALGAMHNASDALHQSEHDLESIDERLHGLRVQARKHQCTVDDLADKRNALAEQLNMIEHHDAHLANAIMAEKKAREVYVSAAESVSNKRTKAAKTFAVAVQNELAPLKMERTVIYVDIAPLPEDKWNGDGMESIRFLVATNAGVDPAPLNKVASGGEMARIMLAMRVVLAASGMERTLIFDEIDSGVGGAVAASIGARLSRLSKNHQVMVVTHSPQIAAQANHHNIVAKSDANNQTTTRITSVQNNDERRTEIARMLSGSMITDEAKQAADKLIEYKEAV